MIITSIPTSSNPHVKVWIFQSDKTFTTSDIQIINKQLSQFIETWQAHGSDMQANFEILHNHFIIIKADQSITQASGCSIDKLVHTIQQMGELINVDFLNNRKVAYQSQDDIHFVEPLALKQAIAEGKILPETIIFNNTANNLTDFVEKWQQPAASSWLARYFKIPAVSTAI